jgi:hypothetical protein
VSYNSINGPFGSLPRLGYRDKQCTVLVERLTVEWALGKLKGTSRWEGSRKGGLTVGVGST